MVEVLAYFKCCVCVSLRCCCYFFQTFIWNHATICCINFRFHFLDFILFFSKWMHVTPTVYTNSSVRFRYQIGISQISNNKTNSIKFEVNKMRSWNMSQCWLLFQYYQIFSLLFLENATGTFIKKNILQFMNFILWACCRLCDTMIISKNHFPLMYFFPYKYDK